MKEWIYGRNPVYEILRAGRRQVYRLQIAVGIQINQKIKRILSLCEKRKIPIQQVERDQLEVFSANNQGLALEVSEYNYADLIDINQAANKKGEDLFVLFLDLIQDPQNFGTLLRTAEAVGIHCIVIPANRAVAVTPAVVNASSGATEYLSICQSNLSQAIDYFKQQDVWFFGLENSPQAIPIQKAELNGPIGLVVGSEGSGLRDLVRRKCDFLIKLPMAGMIESLNAATAGSIALYWAYTAREAKKTAEN